MAPASPAARVLPDIAADAGVGVAGRLDWVGMGDIEAPVTLLGDDGAPVRSAARVSAYVNLRRPEVRGIHMSRLYLHVDQVLGGETLTPAALRRLLRDFLASQGDLSDRAMVRIRFDHLVRRPALTSGNSGWRSYPVTITGLLDEDHHQLELAFQVLYSSTCPCSAALARQLIQERFARDFAEHPQPDRQRVLAWLGTEQGICATPHSQRSAAEVKVRLKPAFTEFPIVALVDLIENALMTPVQTAVKREDEQAFAGLNGSNPMFCEDAARRMQATLDADDRVADFWVRASHFESLHAHNAIAVASKGLAGGYRAGAGD